MSPEYRERCDTAITHAYPSAKADPVDATVISKTSGAPTA